MKEITHTNQFKRDYKLILKRGKSLTKLKSIFDILVSNKIMPEKYKDHKLYEAGNYTLNLIGV